jgi:uncharacterized protein YbaA (DUF1428 family)
LTSCIYIDINIYIRNPELLSTKGIEPMYISGWVVPVPNEKREAFKAWADSATTMFKEHGAVSAVNGWGEDVPDGEVTSFPMAVKLQPDETVVFGWIVWPDKAARDASFQAMMSDPRMAPDKNPMPADGRRIIFGGFSLLNRM